MAAALTNSGHFVAVYSSAVVPLPQRQNENQDAAPEYDSIYLSVRPPPGVPGATGKTVYSDLSADDDDDSDTDEGEQQQHRDDEANHLNDKDDNDEDEDDDDEDDDDEEEDDDDDDTDSSWTESFSYTTNTSTTDEGISEEEADLDPELFGLGRSVMGLTDDLYLSSQSAHKARQAAATSAATSAAAARPATSAAAMTAGGGGNGSSCAPSESESSDEGVGYRPGGGVDTTTDGPGKEDHHHNKKSDYVTMMTSSYMPVDGTTNEAAPEDVQTTLDALAVGATTAASAPVEQSKAAAVASYSTQPALVEEPSDAEDATRMSLLEMMDDREIKRRLFFVLSELPLRQRSDILRQLITCSTTNQWHDLPATGGVSGDGVRRSALNTRAAAVAAAAAASGAFAPMSATNKATPAPAAAATAGGRRMPPPMLQKSSSFIHRTRHLNDPHKSDARHYYVSHHADGKAKATTLQRHGVDKDMIELSRVAQDDALREKEDRKRREEVEAQVLEAFRAATEGKPKQDPAAERRLKRDLRKLLMRRRSSGLKKKHLSFDRKWNEEYQALLDKGIWNMSANDAQEISNLMHDFVFNVETYAKVIINELNVDDSKKTIKPVEVGGIAGGKKYVVQGILFKFCKDPRLSKKPPIWLYGGDKPRDDYAMKAAGLELQGLSLLATPSLMTTLRHPLMSLIDYKGFRMVAMCLLPLDVTSLRYGSDDGGKTVVASDPTLNRAMEKVGRMFNLKKHTVGKERVPIIGPGDIEGHLGTDGRYYLLDFARLMPPEAPPSSQSDAYADRAVFYKMLRPEIVKEFHVPLSSDAFTGWSKYDNDIVASERDIREATKKMFDEVIPTLARDLDDTDISDFFERVLKEDAANDVDYLLVKLNKQTNTVYEMHRRGINMRHIGRLRKLVKNKYWRIMLLSEAMSRCIKHQIRYKMRKAVKNSIGVSSESSCKDLVLEHVNIFFGSSRESDRFWKKKIKRVSAKKFPGLLTALECKPSYDLRKSLSLRLVFLLAERWNILRLTDRIKRELLTKNIFQVRVLPGDVEEITASVKHFPLVHAIDASLYLMEAMNPECDDDEALRLLTSANEHLTRALDEKPRASHMLWSLGLEPSRSRSSTAPAFRRPGCRAAVREGHHVAPAGPRDRAGAGHLQLAGHRDGGLRRQARGPRPRGARAKATRRGRIRVRGPGGRRRQRRRAAVVGRRDRRAAGEGAHSPTPGRRVPRRGEHARGGATRRLGPRPPVLRRTTQRLSRVTHFLHFCPTCT